MKFLIDISDNKVESFLQLLNSRFDIKVKSLSARDAAVLEESHHIEKAFKLAEKVKVGKIKSRPVSDLLNEL